MPSTSSATGLAVVTGASSGIGYHLAHQAAQAGYDLIIAADEPAIATAAAELLALGMAVEGLETDLSTTEGIDRLMKQIEVDGRPVDLLMANAGRGVGNDFLDENFIDVRKVIDTNITGTLYLVHRIANGMRARRAGRILITGSIAGYVPGTYQAVYNATKAFLNNFSFALREELEESGVTVTCLMPGATETLFFDRADMRDTAIGQSKKDDPADVARIGFKAMLNGEGDVATGLTSKVLSTLANVVPAGILANLQGKIAKPGSGEK